jgi:hypothetical protein
MKIDSHEMKQLAATQPARLDLYTGIHKALRACMADALLALGRMDPDDDLELADATERVMQLLDFCAGHVHHENEFVHTAIEARAPGAAAALARDHEEHEREIARLAAAVGALRGAPRAERATLAAALYAELGLFVAGNFRHMRREEVEHNAVLWACYTDAELAQIQDALIGSIPPQELLETMRWLVPALNHAERVALLAKVQAKAPPPAFRAMLGVAAPHLRATEWDKLTDALGVSA